jgi:PAS domain S-box-containing protein
MQADTEVGFVARGRRGLGAILLRPNSKALSGSLEIWRKWAKYFTSESLGRMAELILEGLTTPVFAKQLLMNRFRLLAHSLKGGRGSRAELAKVGARLNGIIFSAMDAIISIDAEQRIVLFNPAAEKMFGVSAQDVLGQKIDRFIPQRFRAAQAAPVDQFGETGVSFRRMGALGMISGQRANGEEFPIEASISQVDADGEKLFTVILRDVSERQRAEKNLRDALEGLAKAKDELEIRVQERTVALRQTIADLEAFSQGLSHDMRAPLRAIRNLTRIFMEDYGVNVAPDGLDLLRRVADSTDRMDRLMQDLLAFSRVTLQPIEFGVVDPEKLIRELINERPEFRRPKATIEIQSPLLSVRAHPASLMQCLANLLSNAVKFVGPGIVPRVRIWSERINDQVRLLVEDNGIGIPREAQRKVFEVFKRLHSATDYEGSGIGLSLVRKAVERMGGKVGLESEPGEGSRFWIELPTAFDEPKPAGI